MKHGVKAVSILYFNFHTENMDELNCLKYEIYMELNVLLLFQISALAMDPSGARLASGGYDYELRFWDFAGMDSTLQSFRTIRPCERLVSNPIVNVIYNIEINILSMRALDYSVWQETLAFWHQ